ncbi:MAG: hypothetical protein AAGA87_14955 [Pseudomonadota bacterium]
MAKTAKILLLASTALAVAGCTAESKLDFNSEAGSIIDNGYFGNATLTNLMAQKRHNHPHAGPLNGQYGQVIFDEYISSAVPPTEGIEVDAGVEGGE